MYLFEYQAKALMRDWGIPVLEGAVATSEQRALDAARELGEGPWVVKAQIHAGATRERAASKANRIFPVLNSVIRCCRWAVLRHACWART